MNEKVFWKVEMMIHLLQDLFHPRSRRKPRCWILEVALEVDCMQQVGSAHWIVLAEYL
jgi:hypothetical protein